MIYYAHSPREGILAQPYKAHIEDVVKRATKIAEKLAIYGAIDGDLLILLADASSRYHDLGKLEMENQNVLSGKVQSRHLPYHHQDAGVAHFKSDDCFCIIAAAIISSHHAGFPNMSLESDREAEAFRDRDIKTIEKTDSILKDIKQIHESLISSGLPVNNTYPKGDLPVFMRLLLSCLVDADHTNTAMHRGNYPKHEKEIKLLPLKRLEKLDNYVSELGSGTSERDILRNEMYFGCQNANITAPISYCDSPVGTGKTTAIMSHLLNHAHENNLRRIIVVLPFTAIIEQSVNTYRKALVLANEKPEEVVAEIHHRADFDDIDIRHLNALWRAPIIVTTAVAFFETLSSNNPSTLRRLHELPGSAIFLDESHAALPAKLLPIAWRWMNIFANEWSCYWVLASGSLCRFWEIDTIAQDRLDYDVPGIIDHSLREHLNVFEQNRISYHSRLHPVSINELVEWVAAVPGPRLVIFNTVQNAAVVANAYAERFGRINTEHLSTALTAIDRKKTLDRIKRRLEDDADNDFALFATSSAEAGLDLSFRNGFRELGATVSLLQAAGRVNRNDEFEDSQMWTFVLSQQERMVNSNQKLSDAVEVLRGYLENNVAITHELSTDAIDKEIRLHGVDGIYKELLVLERLKEFESVNNLFNVIESDSEIVVVDANIAERICNGQSNWRELQQNSVQIHKYHLQELGVPIIKSGIYHWKHEYNDFLGYMAGIIALKKFEVDTLLV